METVWRVIAFYGDFMVKLVMEIVWGFYGENMVNQITRKLSMDTVWRQCRE